MNAKISAFVICVEVIMYFLLYNLQDRTFNENRSLVIYIFMAST